ncbi:MAG: potassium transporter Kup [Caulobacteraceae bacterium]
MTARRETSTTPLASKKSEPEAQGVLAEASVRRRRPGLVGLAIGSVGVVFGDIGTSPLYAFQAAMGQAAKQAVGDETVIGVVSLALWAIFLIVTVKYVIFVMRADNKGEGGILSLMALAQRAIGRRTPALFVLGLAGAALFYGDALITPAISVLGAFQGLHDVPQLRHVASTHLITLFSAILLLGLFLFQSRGTATLARWFSPVMIIWFVSIAALGADHVIDEPKILWAFAPTHAVMFMVRHGLIGFFVLGSVFLTVTGAEALYADMGHFGRTPIRAAWLFLALPCLTLNYLGQGAFALKAIAWTARHHHAFVDLDWFFVMAPPALRWPLVILSVLASVIASQAVISGAYSLTQQAMQLGLVPRLDIRRTSETQSGQIYMPQVNTFLMVGVLILVLVFESADNLTDAYGLAVTGTMLATTIMAYIVARRLWKWRFVSTLLLIVPLISLDTVFLAANGLKVISGGWVPLTIGTGLLIIMITWVRGGEILTEKTRRDSIPIGDLIEMLRARPPARAAGNAVFLTADPDMAPVALMHNLKHNKVLHAHNAILNVRTTETPRVREEDRIEIEKVNDDFDKVRISYGFMENPNLPHALQLCRKKGLKFDIMSTSFFLGRRSIVPANRSRMPLWQDKLYIFLMKNATNPTDFFKIPPGRVVELGTQVTL